MNPVKRIKNNSESLKKNYSDVYREFFSTNSIVTSTSGSFYFVGEHSTSSGGMAISQKLPLRAYVGLENIEAGVIEEGDVRYYDSALCHWERETFFNENDFTLLREVILNELQKFGVHKGYKINALFEMPTKCGVNSSGAVCSALACALLLDNNIVSALDVQSFNQQPYHELIINKKFDLIFRLAWKMSAVLHSGQSSGGTIFSALVNNNYPIIYFIEKKGNECNSHTNAGDYDTIDKIEYKAFRIQDLQPTDGVFIWPFDFGLVYSGHSKSSNIAVRSLDSTKSTFNDIAKFNKSIFEDKISSEEIEKVYFLGLLEDESKNYWNSIINLANHISMECLHRLCQLFSGRIDNYTLYNFFRSINRYYNIFQFLGTTNISLNKARSHILSTANMIDVHLGCGVKICGGGMGGDLLFVAPKGYFTVATTKEMVERLNEKLNRNDIGLDYSSWMDGTESKGLVIDQYLDGGLYSDYVSRGSIVVENINKDERFTEVISAQEFEAKKSNYEILLDTTDDLLYLGGQKIKSDEIPSAVTAINVLVKLIDDSAHRISSRDLEASSYTEDRNIFQSKIIGPMVKAVKKHCKKDLDFKLTGQITNFHVSLDLDDLKIGIVRKKI